MKKKLTYRDKLLELAKIGERYNINTNCLSNYEKGEGMDKTIANAEV